jgi:hypothetical protein
VPPVVQLASLVAALCSEQCTAPHRTACSWLGQRREPEGVDEAGLNSSALTLVATRVPTWSGVAVSMAAFPGSLCMYTWPLRDYARCPPWCMRLYT